MKKTLLIFMILLLPFIGKTQSWQIVNTYTSYILTDISFPPGQSLVGFSVGESSTYNGTGMILKTIDGGTNWTQVPWTPPGLEACCFTNMNTGYIGGWQNYFAKTTNGGITWTPIIINPGIWYIKEIDFYDDNHGIVSCQGGEAYVTADGGTTWTASTGLVTTFEDVDYVTPNLLFAVGGDEKIQKSVNGGLTWTTIYSGAFGAYLTGVDFYNTNYGIVGGDDAKVMITTDGGTTWTTQYVGGYAIYHGVKVYSTDSAYVAGTPEMIYKTINGGNAWTADYPSAGNFALYKIIFLPNGVGLSCGSQGKMLIKSPSYMTASFTNTPSYVCQGDTIHFTSTSTGNITSWQWTFPGGTPATSTLQNPSVVFNSSGNSNVQLIISNGTNSVSTQHNISINEYPSQPFLFPQTDTVCSSDSTICMANDPAFADSCIWEIIPTNAATQQTLHYIHYNILTLHWQPGYSGLVKVVCYGINSCGSGPVSDTLVFIVNPAPQPVITGPSTVCTNSQHVYQTTNNPGNTYTWTVDGGGVIISPPPAGFSVLVQWGPPGIGAIWVQEMSPLGCVGITSVPMFIEPCTSIEEQTSNSISIYPNPVTDIMKIVSFYQVENIEIYSATASKVLTVNKIPTNGEVNLSFLPAGFYVLKIRTSAHQETILKLIKQ